MIRVTSVPLYHLTFARTERTPDNYESTRITPVVIRTEHRPRLGEQLIYGTCVSIKVLESEPDYWVLAGSQSI